MFSALESRLRAWARWPVILGLAALSLLILFVLFPRLAPGGAGAPPDILDVRLRYSVAEAQAHMDALTPAERQAAGWMHLTADLAFPLVYSTLFALLLLKAWPDARLWRLALVNLGLDVAENLLLTALYWAYPRLLTRLTPLASFVTTLKWGMVAVTLLYFIRGGYDRWTEGVLRRMQEDG